MSTVPARFEGLSLYEILSVERSATSEQIKKAYRRQALKFHPDHNHSAQANEEFAMLAKAHEILSDNDRRAHYDDTGDVNESVSATSISTDAVDYWRSVFPAVTPQEIDAYRAKYIDSDEEAADISDAYKRYEGDLDSLYESIPFIDSDNIPRIAKILNAKCKAKLTQKQIERWQKKIVKLEKREAREFSELSENGTADEKSLVVSGGGIGTLASLIAARQQQRQAQHSAFIDTMTAKYKDSDDGEPRRGRRSKAKVSEPAEPSEEEFAAAQQRLLKRQKKSK